MVIHDRDKRIHEIKTVKKLKMKRDLIHQF